MLYDKERVLGFGKKEALSPTAALRRVYETDDEVAVIIDGFARRRSGMLDSNDMLVADRVLLETLEADTLRKLSDLGMELSKETLEEFLETL